MGSQLISVKCPDCGHTLSIDDSRTQALRLVIIEDKCLWDDAGNGIALFCIGTPVNPELLQRLLFLFQAREQRSDRRRAYAEAQADARNDLPGHIPE